MLPVGLWEWKITNVHPVVTKMFKNIPGKIVSILHKYYLKKLECQVYDSHNCRAGVRFENNFWYTLLFINQ